MIYKLYLSIALSFTIAILHAQVGINTNSPRGAFHIDGLGNTPATGAVTKAQESDDVIITADGIVGIGTINPLSTTKLDVRGKVRISDGTTINNGSALFSDNNGFAYWELPKSNTILANLGGGINITLNNPTTFQTWIRTGGTITLPPGKSLVQGTFYNKIVNIPTNGFVVLNYVWSDSSTSITKNKFKYINTAQEGMLTMLGSYPSTEMVGSGYWAIENTSSSDLTLYLFTSAGWGAISNASNTQLVGVGADYWPETLVAAFPWVD